MKVVVCDDDPTLRGVVGKLATVLGYQVLAETDSGIDAVQLVERFRADVLVLDLALHFGSGRDAIRSLREKHSPCKVVVFTAFGADDPSIHSEGGVRAVVEKPDFDKLELVLRDVLHGSDSGSDERRAPEPERPTFPAPGPVSPSGLEDPTSFQAALAAMHPGDAVLVVRVSGLDAPGHLYGRTLATDWVLAVARSVREVLRIQDRLTLGDDEHELVAILLNGRHAGVESAWTRIEQAHAEVAAHGSLSAGWCLADGAEHTATTLSRAQDAAVRSVGQPAGDRLWAG